MNYLRLLITAPLRAWSWGQLHPGNSILYGLLLFLMAFISRPVLVAIGAACILSGLVASFRPGPDP